MACQMVAGSHLHRPIYHAARKIRTGDGGGGAAARALKHPISCMPFSFPFGDRAWNFLSFSRLSSVVISFHLPHGAYML